MNGTENLAAHLKKRHDKLKVARSNNATISNDIWTYLQESENQFIQFMNGTPPPSDAPGNLEYGWILSFLNNDIPGLPSEIRVILGELQDVLKDMGMPPSQTTQVQWEKWLKTLNSVGVLTGDGTLVSTARYAQVDWCWSLAVLDYFLVVTGIISTVSFNTACQQISVPNQSTLKIALFSDWGSGAYEDCGLPASPSQMVMQQIRKMAPDIAIHLGDVYYSGTRENILGNVLEGEEYKNLVACWDYNAPLGNFLLNSNHEMYDGGNGLFNVALNSDYTSLFQAQANSSFFSISFGNWLIVGLDSAYRATSMFMDGVINDSAQIELLQQAGKSGKNIIILTHHNPLNEMGSLTNSLWQNVTNPLAKSPDYWYWGHIHNGIVYANTSAGGATQCRCVGNAAIPIGHASGFENNHNISFFTSSPLGDPCPNNALRVKNGFVMLEIDGTTNTLSEHWYYQDGTLAWSSSESAVS